MNSVSLYVMISGLTFSIITRSKTLVLDQSTMSLMPLTLYPAAFPTTVDNRWSIRHVLTPNNRVYSIKINVTKPLSQLNQTPNHATRATSLPVPVSVPTQKMLELERKQNTSFWFREWDKVDMTNVGLTFAKHVLAVCAPFMVNGGAIRVAMVLLFFTGMGVTLGYHRLLTHRSFKVPKWLEYFFAYCGLHAGEKDPIFWVSTHKYHHKYTDTERDPHSPKEGFWFSHIGWVHHNDYLAAKCGESRSGEYSNVQELKAQWFYRFLHDTYVWHTIGLGVVLYLLGGFPYLAWGLGMREAVTNHCTFFINSVCHIWGDRAWNTPDTSTNNWWVALLTFGEGWHNNHHAFPSSACQGLEWWQFDLTWELIKFLEMVGLAKDVKLPTKAEKKRMM